MQVTPSGSALGWQFKRHKIDSNISVIRIEENIEQKNKKYCRNKQPTAILHNNNTANQPTQSYLTLAAFTPLHWPPSNQIFCCFDYRKNDVCVRLFGAKSNAFWEIAEKKNFRFCWICKFSTGEQTKWRTRMRIPRTNSKILLIITLFLTSGKM